MTVKKPLLPLGAAQKVPNRKGMSYTEENWIDEMTPPIADRRLRIKE